MIEFYDFVGGTHDFRVPKIDPFELFGRTRKMLDCNWLLVVFNVFDFFGHFSFSMFKNTFLTFLQLRRRHAPFGESQNLSNFVNKCQNLCVWISSIFLYFVDVPFKTSSERTKMLPGGSQEPPKVDQDRPTARKNTNTRTSIRWYWLFSLFYAK